MSLASQARRSTWPGETPWPVSVCAAFAAPWVKAAASAVITTVAASPPWVGSWSVGNRSMYSQNAWPSFCGVGFSWW